MNVSTWSIRNPTAPILLFLLLMVLGWQSFKALPVTRFPSIDMPLIAVSIRQPGATPVEMESEVTQQVEDAVAGLARVRNVSSHVTDGVSTTQVEFRMEVPVHEAVQDVRDVIGRLHEVLPEDAGAPAVASVDVEGQAMMTLAVSASVMSLEELSWFVDDVIKGRLQGQSGIARVDRYGGAEREIRLELDPARLDAYGITATEVSQQIRAINIDSGAGRSEIGGAEHAIRLLGDQGSAEQLAASPIALPSGQRVRLAHLGTVIDSHEEIRSFARLDGEEVVAFAVFRTKGASEVSVAETVNTSLADIRVTHPHVEITLLDDAVSFTVGNYEAAIHTLIEGAILAVLVIMVFLRNWRATIIAAVALPLSIVPTFWLMEVLGFSLNLVSLLAITLTTGVLVDDAIVEVENIQRHIAKGKTPYRAASDASDEICLAVIATTMTIVAVFVPVAFMPGIAGQYFYQFGLTVAIAVLFSLLVARLITPLLAAHFMTGRAADQHEPKVGVLMQGYLNVVRTTSVGRVFAIPTRYLTLVAAFGILLISSFYLKQIPGSFLPSEDVGLFVVSVELPPGATLADTDSVAEQVHKVIRPVDGVRSVFVHGGVSPVGGLDARRAMVTILLEDRHDTLRRRVLALIERVPHVAERIPYGRPVGRTRPQSEIEVEVLQRLAVIPDVRALLLNGRGNRDISYSILSDNGNALDLAVAQLEEALAGEALLQDVSTEGVLARPEVQIVPRADEAARLGVTTAAIARAVQAATTGDIDGAGAKVSVADRVIPVRIQLIHSARDDIARFRALRIPIGAGRTIPLNAVADVRLAEGPGLLKRLNGERVATIGATLPSLVPLGAATARFEEIIADVDLPVGVRIAESGDAEAQDDLFQAFKSAMSLGILLVLLVLILLFKSVIQPFAIILSLPLAIGGAAAALILTSSPISMPVLIGILMLTGIVTKNAILLVDCAIEMRAKEMSRADAVVEAGRKRARPIVMTSIAMSAGMLPSALGVGEGGAFRAPMATAVIGGIIGSTMLSLVIVPSFILIMDDLQRLLDRGLKRFSLRGTPLGNAKPVE